MRHELLKLTKRKSTKAERVFAEVLKEHHIPFRTKVRIGKYEVDFLIGNKVVEINGHEQDPDRNNYLMSLGYVPIHFSNSEITNNRKLILTKINAY